MRSLLAVLVAVAGSFALAGEAEAGAVDKAKAAAAKLKAAVVKKFGSSVRRPTVVVAVRGELIRPRVFPENYGVEVWIIPESKKRYCHRDWCRQLRAVQPGQREGFFWLEVACIAGYRPCPVCRPDDSNLNEGGVWAAKGGPKTFHVPACEHAGKLQPAQQRFFPSAEAAAEAGLKPCPQCKPADISPHAAALGIVLATQGKAVAEVEGGVSRFDPRPRRWDVKRPVGAGRDYSLHLFRVDYWAKGKIAATWWVDTRRKEAIGGMVGKEDEILAKLASGRPAAPTARRTAPLTSDPPRARGGCALASSGESGSALGWWLPYLAGLYFLARCWRRPRSRARPAGSPGRD